MFSKTVSSSHSSPPSRAVNQPMNVFAYLVGTGSSPIGSLIVTVRSVSETVPSVGLKRSVYSVLYQCA